MPRICNISGLLELKQGTLNIRLQHGYEERPDFTIPRVTNRETYSLSEDAEIQVEID